MDISDRNTDLEIGKISSEIRHGIVMESTQISDLDTD